MQSSDSADAQRPERATGRVALLFVIVLFAFALAVTIFLGIANMTLESDIARARAESADLDASIAKIRDDRDVQAYEYYEKSRDEIEKTVRLSMAQQYISDFLDVSRRYNIGFYGFSFSGDRVATSARSENLGDVRYDAVEKVSAFIRDYRTSRDASLFLLAPVLSVGGSEARRDFAISFSVNTSAVLSRQQSSSGATATGSTATGRVLAPSASGSSAASGASSATR